MDKVQLDLPLLRVADAPRLGVRAELLPEQKLAIIKPSQREHGDLAMPTVA